MHFNAEVVFPIGNQLVSSKRQERSNAECGCAEHAIFVESHFHSSNQLEVNADIHVNLEVLVFFFIFFLVILMEILLEPKRLMLIRGSLINFQKSGDYSELLNFYTPFWTGLPKSVRMI